LFCYPDGAISSFSRNQDASQVGQLDGKTLPGRNQVPSNWRSSALFSGPCNGQYSGATMFQKHGSGMTPSQEPQMYPLRSSTDEFVQASALPEFGLNQTPRQQHPKKLVSEATSSFADLDFDIQTPSQFSSKKIFLGPAHGADTPLTEYGSDQTHLQHSAKKFSLVSANGEYTRAATTFVLNSNDIHTEESSKKLCPESSVPLYIKATNLFAELEANESPLKNNSKSSSFLMNDKHIGATAALFPDLDSSPLKPETPATQAVIPRLKRVQEEQGVADNKQSFPLWVSNKKMKSAHCSPVEKKDHDEMTDSARSKFEWLNPSNIRDANRRRPDDPLYDKSTLFIPPDALRKMSASQKQYWNIKCKYMDVVLFFKVVRFIIDDSIHGMLVEYYTVLTHQSLFLWLTNISQNLVSY
jgi:DNA mismatch repair protein MSH6